MFYNIFRTQRTTINWLIFAREKGQGAWGRDWKSEKRDL